MDPPPGEAVWAPTRASRDSKPVDAQSVCDHRDVGDAFDDATATVPGRAAVPGRSYVITRAPAFEYMLSS